MFCPSASNGMNLSAEPWQGVRLQSLFARAVAAVHPDAVIAQHLPEPPEGRVIIIGAGKASAAMAAAVEKAWPDANISGMVVTRYGHGAECQRVCVVEASHPVPDQASVAAAQKCLDLASTAREGDLVLCLMSGGASALLALPQDGLTLADKQLLSRQLLASGAPIGDINRVRIALSAIKGGRLAAAARPARVHTIVISDVPGDDPALVGSGPSVGSLVKVGDVRAIFERYAIDLPDAVRSYLDRYDDDQTLGSPGDTGAVTTVAASARTMLDAAVEDARRMDIEARIIGENIEGEARDVAAAMAADIHAAIAVRRETHPLLFLSGGETTVTKTGTGRGGRNTEFLLALCIAMGDAHPYWAIACDSDGIDGSETNAGAVIDDTSLARAGALGLDPHAFLANNDSYGFFKALDRLIYTGPTRTNVNDFRAILIDAY